LIPELWKAACIQKGNIGTDFFAYGYRVKIRMSKLLSVRMGMENLHE
jgi:hypothetical protein